ncbi:Recombining binding protein suppressor of hairless-like protein [Takifugu flavidus]|uniref:Recombining binding protein suppressor of hairless-like protein n=1 Tax=Takifugu flavidus TaxID=433684 RepID=A0A5C6MJ34_9TELE|nr:Recombining binding protein suppressor of hairless-like protein [Takifugu flavidus]
MDQLDTRQDGGTETQVPPPGPPLADTHHLFPPAAAPGTVGPLTHLGTLLAGDDAPGSGEWDRWGQRSLGSAEPGITGAWDQRSLGSAEPGITGAWDQRSLESTGAWNHRSLGSAEPGIRGSGRLVAGTRVIAECVIAECVTSSLSCGTGGGGGRGAERPPQTPPKIPAAPPDLLLPPQTCCPPHSYCPPRPAAPPRSAAPPDLLPPSFLWWRSSPWVEVRPDSGLQDCQQLGVARQPGREAPADQSVTILHAKVAQKSYGNEKRFFCPPPCVYISGRGWRVMQDHLKEAGYGDSVYRLGGYMCLDSSSQSQADTFKLVFDQQSSSKMFACAKSLFISDQDKRKHFCLLLRLFLGNRQEVGLFQSRLIKVISKPSQKRQSMKNADLCISSCSRVALFNRLRSQTVSTRYLSVDRGAFIVSARQWTAFTITLVDEQRSDHRDVVLSEGFICYGCVVQLVCTESGVTLPPMVIRKVNKQHAILDVDEPVSQLHKCAFQFRDSSHSFLCLSNDSVVRHQASCSPRDPSRVVLNDGSCWTIIGVEAVEFTFNQGLACVPTPVTPFPVIVGLEVNGGGHVAMLEIHGENFSPHLKVWFGTIETDTMYKKDMKKQKFRFLLSEPLSEVLKTASRLLSGGNCRRGTSARYPGADLHFQRRYLSISCGSVDQELLQLSSSWSMNTVS